MDFLIFKISIATKVFSNEVGAIASKPSHAFLLIAGALEAKEEAEHAGADNILLIELVDENVTRLSRVCLR